MSHHIAQLAGITALTFGLQAQAAPAEQKPEPVAPEASLPSVTITAQRLTKPKLVHTCDISADGSANIPAEENTAMDALGVRTCIKGDFEKIFATPGATRLRYFDQLGHAYSELAKGVYEGKKVGEGFLPVMNNMFVSELPDPNGKSVKYSFSWTVQRPEAEVTLFNALPDSERRGKAIASTVEGVICIPLPGKTTALRSN